MDKPQGTTDGTGFHIEGSALHPDRHHMSRAHSFFRVRHNPLARFLRALMVFVLVLVLSVQAFPISVQAAPVYSFMGTGLSLTRPAPLLPALFPGLAPGVVQQTRTHLILAFPYLHENPVSLSGRAIRLPVQSGAGNAGTLNVLLDKTTSADFGGGRLMLKREGLLLRPNERVRIGEAVLALQKKPASEEPLKARTPAPILDESLVYVTANGMGMTSLDMAPAGYLVRVPIWMESRGDRTIHISLGNAPEPVPGKLVDAKPSETLRYVSSDTLLPSGYVPTLSWTRNLSCIRNQAAFAFQGEVLSALRAMLKDAAAKGISAFDLSNSYRSAAYQKQLFDRRYNLSKADPTIPDPLAATLRRVTKPNGSEHQTGMAIDIFSTTTREETFVNTPQYAFIQEQGWKYGFLVRYPDGTEHKTRIMFEPWHIRWFDRPVAAWLHRENRVFEEFTSLMRLQGALWLGNTGRNQTSANRSTGIEMQEAVSPLDDENVIWLAVMATPEAEFASAISSYAPERSHFLPDRQIWLVPMGTFGEIPAMHRE